MKIKKSTRKKVKKVAKRVKRTVNRYATKIGLRRKNPKTLDEVIDYDDYERRGKWNDAELMWTCKECGGRPGKAVSPVLERPEYVRHWQDCKIKRKQESLLK